MSVRKIATHLNETIEAVERVDVNRLNQVIETLREAYAEDATVFTFGNGGSHSTASHFANDLLKVCGIRTFCISDMIPTILAYNNDNGISQMFDLPITQLIDHATILVGFSCSGNSPNIVQAFANRLPLEKILFTGVDGGNVKDYADIVIKVPNPNIRIQESVHLTLCHAIIEVLANDK